MAPPQTLTGVRLRFAQGDRSQIALTLSLSKGERALERHVRLAPTAGLFPAILAPGSVSPPLPDVDPFLPNVEVAEVTQETHDGFQR